MVTPLFIINYLLVIAIVFLMARKAGINMLVPSIPSIFIWSYFVFAYLGTLPLYFFWDKYRYNLGVNDQTKILELWAYSSLSIIIIVLMFLVLKRVFKIELVNDFAAAKVNGKLNPYVQVMFIGLFILCIGMVLLYIRAIPAIPLLEQLRGASALDIKRARSAATNGFGGKLHWYRLFYSSMLTFVSYYAFSLALQTKKVWHWLFFGAAFAVTTFCALMTTQKAPVIFFFVGLTIVYLITRGKKITLPTALFIVTFAVVGLIFLYRNFMGMADKSILDVVQAIMSRLFAGQIAPAYFYLQMFPDHTNYLFGGSLPNPQDVFPWDHYRITVEVMNFMYPAIQALGVVGSAPTVFWAEMYANFGISGIIFSSMLVGIGLYMMQYIIFKIQINPITIALTTWLILNFKDLATTSFSNYLLDIDFFVLITVATVALFISNPHAIIDRVKAWKQLLLQKG